MTTDCKHEHANKFCSNCGILMPVVNKSKEEVSKFDVSDYVNKLNKVINSFAEKIVRLSYVPIFYLFMKKLNENGIVINENIKLVYLHYHKKFITLYNIPTTFTKLTDWLYISTSNNIYFDETYCFISDKPISFYGEKNAQEEEEEEEEEESEEESEEEESEEEEEEEEEEPITQHRRNLIKNTKKTVVGYKKRNSKNK